MLNLGLKLNNNRVGGDANVSAFLAATGLTGTTEVNAVKQLVANLKSYGLWSKMKAIYPFVSDQRNLLGYTEDFSNAAWTKQQATISVDQTTAPDGTLTADKLVENTANDTHRVFQSNVQVDITQTYTYSIYVKQAGRTAVMLRGIAGTDKYSYINISNGTYISGNITPTIANAGNGWYRISISFQPTSVNFTPYLFLSILDNPTYIGDGTSGVYIWGAQLEQASSPSTYQKTSTTASSVFVQQFKYNLKDPRDLDAAFRLAFNGTWTYAKTGVTPNGTNAYADTFLNMLSVLTNNNNHMSVYSRTNSTAASKIDMGITDNTTHSNQLSANWNGSSTLFENGNQIINVAYGNSLGYYIGTSTAINSGKLYKNGAVFGTSTTTNTYALFNNKMYLGATNVSSTNTPTYYSDKQQAFATIGDGLSDTEAANLYTAVQKYQTTLSRQV